MDMCPFLLGEPWDERRRGISLKVSHAGKVSYSVSPISILIRLLRVKTLSPLWEE